MLSVCLRDVDGSLFVVFRTTFPARVVALDEIVALFPSAADPVPAAL
jgi:hypothetical protein